MQMTELLRDRLEGDDILQMVGVPNALAARIAKDAGIGAVLTGGGILSSTLLGMPDAGFISLDQVAMMVSFIADTVDIPVFVDGDTGWGNAIGVSYAVRQIERAGAAGMWIEDQIAPKRCGHIAGKQVVSVDEMCGKIRAAVNARRDPNFVVMARTDARAMEGVEGAVARANAYADAGADMTMVDGALSVEELHVFARDIHSRYRMANMGGSTTRRTTPKVDLGELKGMGYNLVIFGLQMNRVAAKAWWDFANALHRTGIQADIDLLEQLRGTPMEDWYGFTGFNEIRKMEEEYLPADDVAAKYASSAPGYYEPIASGDVAR